METDIKIEVEGGIIVKINDKDGTSSVTKSLEARDNVIIPTFVDHKGKKYKIITISKDSFYGNYIDCLSFPEDSEVEIFEPGCFKDIHITKILIPPKLKYTNDTWLYGVYIFGYITQIAISPQNKNYAFFDDNYILAKSQEGTEIFDVLFWVNRDIKDAVIPAQVKTVKQCTFEHHRAKSVTFPANSQLKCIENGSFSHAAIQKLVLPASVEEVDRCFSNVFNLTNIEVSPESKFFKVNETKYLLKKSTPDISVFDVIVFAPRDVENAIIPPYVKVIHKYAFFKCKKLRTITFEPESSLEVIEESAFSSFNGQEEIVFPPSLSKVCNCAFFYNNSLKKVVFLGKDVTLIDGSFGSCKNLTTVTFSNAESVTIQMFLSSKLVSIYVPRTAELAGKGVDVYKEQLKYIGEESLVFDEIQKALNESQKVDLNQMQQAAGQKQLAQSGGDAASDYLKKCVIDLEKEKIEAGRYICFLQTKLRKFGEFPSLEEFLTGRVKTVTKDCDQSVDDDDDDDFTFVGPDDERFHKVIAKIGEGATSDVFKIVDTRTGRVMVKRVIKETCEDNYFKTLQNSMKEIQIVLSIRHPCICRGLGYNMEEPLPAAPKAAEKDDGSDDESEEEISQKVSEIANKRKMPKTTIALFSEHLPYSVKSVTECGMMNNTLKAKISLEVAFGMLHMHSIGMMHRDLKLDNVMLNSVLDAKIIDFGLAHVGGILAGERSLLTKGIGTLPYMSPEMLSESDYDAKTDVYSYGILLFALFAGHIPKQTMKERLDKVPLKFPKASAKISEYCIALIQRCTSFSPSGRPSFEQVVEDMRKNAFALAAEIDTCAVVSRYNELKAFSGQIKKK